MKLVASVMVALAAVSPAGAKEPCPPRETGTYPWSVDGLMDGDMWAWVYLEIGKDGRPEKCLMGNNNIQDSDQRFFACKAFTDSWEPADAAQAKPGTEVRRFFVIPGGKHVKADSEARKRFFAEHPDQRPQCYPE